MRHSSRTGVALVAALATALFTAGCGDRVSAPVPVPSPPTPSAPAPTAGPGTGAGEMSLAGAGSDGLTVRYRDADGTVRTLRVEDLRR